MEIAMDADGVMHLVVLTTLALAEERHGRLWFATLMAQNAKLLSMQSDVNLLRILTAYWLTFLERSLQRSKKQIRPCLG